MSSTSNDNSVYKVHRHFNDATIEPQPHHTATKDLRRYRCNGEERVGHYLRQSRLGVVVSKKPLATNRQRIFDHNVVAMTGIKQVLSHTYRLAYNSSHHSDGSGRCSSCHDDDM